MTTADDGTAYDVLVVGCGLMGSALARAFARSGLRVAAWNRTFERAEALSDAGVVAVRDLAPAVQDADLLVACMVNSDNVYSALESVDTWHGNLMVNLTTATPEESASFALWAAERGIEALDGSIFNYPFEVGTPGAYLVYSGPVSAWMRGKPVLELLGPSRHVASSPGSSSELLQGMAAYYVPAISCLVEAATYLSRRGMPRDVLLSTADYLTESLKNAMRGAIDAIESGEQRTDQATLNTFAASVESALVSFAAEGLNPRLLNATRRTLMAARDQGLGELGIFAQTKVL